ncbi:hypothetical protein CANARDRAFT_175087 [[Candida] arabinofermentans NRRL YB-2248]|uniref:Uncharacterized protein n=1 Tax=[Candida] arabinofermentans NRRL YB-2248 TaxID=983967 RepID=A0A1E4T316_9ASCO|nr:hypothetical protein CANARDRAFT_175087 [[Candida] arabinofermentans NRRL YB-2248]
MLNLVGSIKDDFDLNLREKLVEAVCDDGLETSVKISGDFDSDLLVLGEGDDTSASKRSRTLDDLFERVKCVLVEVLVWVTLLGWVELPLNMFSIFDLSDLQMGTFLSFVVGLLIGFANFGKNY